ncbi:SCO6745 family protein [Kitasatospora aureofaciens]|uniref:SCO6745 family protein n=1 Tax=Kitasatospora aureofaciens TaxID=1894 RepID=UPI0033C22C79
MSDPAPVHPARALWRLFEPLYAVTFLQPESRAAFEAAGLDGGWRGYFAGRSAPLGAVDAPPVIAAFFSFAPATVERALPQVWTHASPERVLTARTEGSSAALARLLAAVEPGRIEAAADALEGAVDRLDCAGRVLAAANAALPRPADVHGRLWQAAAVLREHRGDGHVAALVAAGLDGCEAPVLHCALDADREVLQPMRGWTDEEWEAAAARLVERGWLTARGAVTELGRSRHRSVEAATDLAAGRAWEGLPDGELDRLTAALRPIAAICRERMPVNPLAMPLVSPLSVPPVEPVAVPPVSPPAMAPADPRNQR